MTKRNLPVYEVVIGNSKSYETKGQLKVNTPDNENRFPNFSWYEVVRRRYDELNEMDLFQLNGGLSPR